MKQTSNQFRVLVPTALFGTVRVAKGDLVRRELLGVNVQRLIAEGVVEPIQIARPQRSSVQATLI